MGICRKDHKSLTKSSQYLLLLCIDHGEKDPHSLLPLERKGSCDGCLLFPKSAGI